MQLKKTTTIKKKENNVFYTVYFACCQSIITDLINWNHLMNYHYLNKTTRHRNKIQVVFMERVNQTFVFDVFHSHIIS